MSLSWKHACLLASACLPCLVRGAEYKLLKDHSGPTFFEGFTFFDGPDVLNSGDVEFIGPDEAFNPATSLAYVDPNTNRAILKVDDKNEVPWNEKRKSVRITSDQAYDFGSVFIADIYHYPYGCSVWSSFWTWHNDAGNKWPLGGEIDIFEAINLAPRSQMGLHTEQGCSIPDNLTGTGSQLSTDLRGFDCYGPTGVEGCIVGNTDPASYGPPLNQVGGGMHVAELAESGISTWFFARDKIPDSLKGNPTTIDTSTFGTPMGSFPSSAACDLKNFFRPQNIVMKITLCGVYAGQQINSTGCQVQESCYLDYVLKEPSRYSEAYFDVGSVRVFSTEGAVGGNASATASRPAASGAPSGRPGSNSTDSPGAEGGATVSVKASLSLVAGVAMVAMLL